MQHAGTAVVFSGTTVAISLLALVALPVPFLRSIGIAGLLIALVSVAVAITLLPVVLATVGPRLDRPRARREDRASRGWSAWARLVVRHRWAAAVVSTAVLAALVVAASTIQLGNPRADSLAKDGPARAGLEQPGGLRHRHRPAVARSTRSSARAIPSAVAGALAGGRRRPQRGRAGRLAPRRDGARHGHPDRGRQLARRPRDARPHPRHAPLPGDVTSAARRHRAPTSSTRSTATSRW